VSAKMIRRAAALALPLALAACDPNTWLTDMKQQPSVGTWQKFSSDSMAGDTIPFRGNPQGSVPTTGIAVAAWQVSYSISPLAVDSMSGLANPVAPDARSLENGHRIYQVNCAVCHGDLGDGNGMLKQLNPAYGFPPPINGTATAARTDGYIFGMLRNGRGLMPPQNRIPEEMRWDVVNYVRGLQGRYQVATGPVARPGQASAYPGVSKVGPTVPPAYLKPSTTGITPKAEKPAEANRAAGHSTGGHE